MDFSAAANVFVGGKIFKNFQKINTNIKTEKKKINIFLKNILTKSKIQW